MEFEFSQEPLRVSGWRMWRGDRQTETLILNLVLKGNVVNLQLRTAGVLIKSSALVLIYSLKIKT